MYYSIEITDSDDDMPESTTDIAKSTRIESESNEHTPEKQHKPSSNSTNVSDLATSSPDDVASTSANANINKSQVRHRPRKTQHTVRNAAETEIQFESIPIDDDEDDSDQTELPEQKININKKLMTNMISKPEVQEIVDRIANERVRCNFLLATFHLPDIDFKLNTPLEVLKHQFNERIKHHNDTKKVLSSTKT